MSPTLIRLHNLNSGQPSTSTFAREPETMQIKYTLYARSTNGSGSGGGLGTNTIIFIVLGVVCLLVILIGFYLVSRPRVACTPAPNVAGVPLQHSPITPPPRSLRKREISEYWKIWGIWRHPSNTDHRPTADSPTSQLSPPSLTIITPTHSQPARGNLLRSCPSIVVRPPQNRRVTSLSVATSFSHSHITEEALSDFRASAYDLDGDLETEMLHSASVRDDMWPVFPLAVEDGCGDVGEALKVRGSVTPIVEGSAEGDVCTRPTGQRGGGDYESLGACQGVGSNSHSFEGGISGVDEKGMRQVLA